MSGWLVLLSRFTVGLFFFIRAPYGWRFTVYHLHRGRAAFFSRVLLLCRYFILFKIILLFTEAKINLCRFMRHFRFVYFRATAEGADFPLFFALSIFFFCVLRHLHSSLYFLYIINVCTYYLTLYLHHRAHCCTFVKDNLAPFLLFSFPLLYNYCPFFSFFELCCSIFTILLLIKY